MIGGFALGLILGILMGVCLYREAHDYFAECDRREQKHAEHLKRVLEWERRQSAGAIEAWIK